MIIHSAFFQNSEIWVSMGVEVKGEIGQNMKGVGGGNIDKIGSLQKIGGGGASNTLPVI